MDVNTRTLLPAISTLMTETVSFFEYFYHFDVVKCQVGDHSDTDGLGNLKPRTYIEGTHLASSHQITTFFI